MCAAEAATFDCSSGTILGRDVVPEVCRISATSSGRGRMPSGGCRVVSDAQGESCQRAHRRATDSRTIAMPALVRGGKRRGRHSRPSTISALAFRSVEVEVIFFLAVGRVQRRGGRRLRNGHKGRGHLRPVRQHDRHPVAAPTPMPCSVPRRLVAQAAQPVIAQPGAVRCADGRRWRRRASDKSAFIVVCMVIVLSFQFCLAGFRSAALRAARASLDVFQQAAA